VTLGIVVRKFGVDDALIGTVATTGKLIAQFIYVSATSPVVFYLGECHCQYAKNNLLNRGIGLLHEYEYRSVIHIIITICNGSQIYNNLLIINYR